MDWRQIQTSKFQCIPSPVVIHVIGLVWIVQVVSTAVVNEWAIVAVDATNLSV